uniref:hypothetical protein n=1 Tax=Paraburkholderia polaris TaxID=2728848 RepID=UPI0038B2A085
MAWLCVTPSEHSSGDRRRLDGITKSCKAARLGSKELPLPRTRGSDVTDRGGGVNYNQFAIGANCTLSSRTDVYAAVVYQTVNGRDSTGGPAVANVNGVSPSTIRHQAVGRLGIRTPSRSNSSDLAWRRACTRSSAILSAIFDAQVRCAIGPR